jgi:muconolactone delta-isomerase
MKILAVEKEVSGVTDDQFTDNILKAEARKAWELEQSGVLRELYFTADTHEAVLVLECDSADEARRRLSELPLMRAGLIDFRLIPLVAYPGFERLFTRKS